MFMGIYILKEYTRMSLDQTVASKLKGNGGYMRAKLTKVFVLSLQRANADAADYR